MFDSKKASDFLSNFLANRSNPIVFAKVSFGFFLAIFANRNRFIILNAHTLYGTFNLTIKEQSSKNGVILRSYAPSTTQLPRDFIL